MGWRKSRKKLLCVCKSVPGACRLCTAYTEMDEMASLRILKQSLKQIAQVFVDTIHNSKAFCDFTN